MHPKAQLQQDLKAAMRAGDNDRKSVIRMALSALKIAEVDKGGALTEEEAIEVLLAEAKKRRESIAEMEKAGRLALAEQERAELAILGGYLPQPLSKDEIAAEARAVIAEVDATSLKDTGSVMRVLMPRLKGRADGRLVNQMVRELLT
jgi:uncharacterized protein YqeY